MNRTLRWAFTGLTALSVLLCMATLYVWAREGEDVGVRGLSASCLYGTVTLTRASNAMGSEGTHQWQAAGLSGGSSSDGTSGFRFVRAPLYAVIVLTAILPVLWLVWRIVAGRRRKVSDAETAAVDEAASGR